jgi:hypothetical protein
VLGIFFSGPVIRIAGIELPGQSGSGSRSGSGRGAGEGGARTPPDRFTRSGDIFPALSDAQAAYSAAGRAARHGAPARKIVPAGALAVPAHDEGTSGTERSDDGLGGGPAEAARENAGERAVAGAFDMRAERGDVSAFRAARAYARVAERTARVFPDTGRALSMAV